MKNHLTQILKSYSGELAQLMPTALKDGGGAKQKQKLENTIMITAALALLVIVASLVIGNKLELIVMALIVVALLVYLYRSQNQFLKQQEEQQLKLHSMASAVEERNRELKRLIMIDPLTEVMNRRGFERVLQSETNRAKRNNTQNFALLIDCDDFKGVNEKYGHSVGDIVLQELSARLQKAIRPSDHVARIGGDEFMILVTDADQSTTLQVAERVRLAVAETPINLADGVTKITTSTGVTALSENLMSIEEILAAANAGLKISKRSGKNSVSFSKPDGKVNEMAEVLEKLRSGECLRTVYQPISQLNNQHVIAYEIQPRGLAGVFEQPDAFFKLAREHNLRTAVDLRCLKLCLAMIDKLPDESDCHIKVFSSTLLDVPVDSLAEIFKPTKRKICLAIGDQEFLAEPLCLKSHVDKLKELGIAIAIDRVGSGFSSLESLFLLDPDFIRLDKSLIKKCETGELHQQFLKKLIKVATQISAKTIAEGIESPEDLRLMDSCGVDYGQGLFWGMPVALSDK
jgi:diguanylate cyclase (GGDEF)-like protein